MKGVPNADEQRKTIVMDDNHQQLIDFQSPDFKFQSTGGHFSKPYTLPWHWHDALEFVHIIKNDCQFQLPHQEILVPEDSLVLFNSGVSHAGGAVDEDHPVDFKTLLIAPKLLAGDAGSLIKSKFFDPILSCHNLPYYIIPPQSPDHARAIELFETAHTASIKRTFMYEMMVRENLSRIWMMFVENTQSIWSNSTPANDVRGDRLKQMLKFVQMNCTEKITLEQIAASADISTRECSRCFQTILRMTPIEYLTDCRVRKAADMLINSPLSIIEISYACGFSTASYFCRIFKKQMGQSPSEYKRAHRNSKME